VEYHETIMAAAGHQAEENLQAAVKKYDGQFICVVEGAIATKYDGAYGKIGGRTFLEIAKEVCPQSGRRHLYRGLLQLRRRSRRPSPIPADIKASARRLGIKTVNILGMPAQSGQFCRNRSQLSSPGQTARVR
jgi:[NiFe] hydrogenase small subunit